MKKRIICLLLAAFMALSLCACGKSSSKDDSSSNTSNSSNDTPDGADIVSLPPEIQKIVGRYFFYPYSWNPQSFAEFYSDGTGYTNYIKTADGFEYSPIRWEYDESTDEYDVYYAKYVGVDSNKAHDNNGYMVYHTTLTFNETELTDGHFFLYCMTDSKVGDIVPRVNVFGVGTDGDWCKMGYEELKTPYGCVELDKNNVMTYEDYKEIWSEYEENFKDGKSYTVDSKANASLDEYVADPKAYKDKYKN